jgi:hypothetical protein
VRGGNDGRFGAWKFPKNVMANSESGQSVFISIGAVVGGIALIKEIALWILHRLQKEEIPKRKEEGLMFPENPKLTAVVANPQAMI